MANYEIPDSTGKRIQWAIENLQWRGEGLTGGTNKDFAVVAGVGYVYLSKIVNNEKMPAPNTMRRIARALGVSRAFLEMETRNLEPLDMEPGYVPPSLEPTYWHAETDALAALVDTWSEPARQMLLEVVRVMDAHMQRNHAPGVQTVEGATAFADRVLSRDTSGGQTAKIRTGSAIRN